MPSSVISIGLVSKAFCESGRTDVYKHDGALTYEIKLPGMKKSDQENNFRMGR